MTHTWIDIQQVPTNGAPYVDETDWNEIVNNDLNANERISIIEAFYSVGGIPLGGAILWYGVASTLQTGWAICDGTNGTPDLRGKFIMGATEDADIGVTGGAETHVHEGGTVSTVAAHDHGISSKNLKTTTAYRNVTGSGVFIGTSGHTHVPYPSVNSKGGHSHSLGVTGATSSLPPYKRLYYITRLP